MEKKENTSSLDGFGVAQWLMLASCPGWVPGRQTAPNNTSDAMRGPAVPRSMIIPRSVPEAFLLIQQEILPALIPSSAKAATQTTPPYVYAGQTELKTFLLTDVVADDDDDDSDSESGGGAKNKGSSGRKEVVTMKIEFRAVEFPSTTNNNNSNHLCIVTVFKGIGNNNHFYSFTEQLKASLSQQDIINKPIDFKITTTTTTSTAKATFTAADYSSSSPAANLIFQMLEPRFRADTTTRISTSANISTLFRVVERRTDQEFVAKPICEKSELPPSDDDEAETGAQKRNRVTSPAKYIGGFSPQTSHGSQNRREIAILKNLEHPHILKLKEVVDANNKMYFVIMERAIVAGGRKGKGNDAVKDLIDTILDAPNGRLPEDEARRYFRQIVSGLSCLHSLGIAHGCLIFDNIYIARRSGEQEQNNKKLLLQPAATAAASAASASAAAASANDGENIRRAKTSSTGVEAEEDVVKLTATGHHRWFDENFRRANQLHHRVDTNSLNALSYHIAPEQLRNYHPLSNSIHKIPFDPFRADIWSLGTVLFAMLAGHYAFDGNSLTQVLQKVERGDYRMSRHFSDLAKDLISKMLQVDPAKRCQLQDIIAHPWFQCSSSSSCEDGAVGGDDGAVGGERRPSSDLVLARELLARSARTASARMQIFPELATLQWRARKVVFLIRERSRNHFFDAFSIWRIVEGVALFLSWKDEYALGAECASAITKIFQIQQQKQQHGVADDKYLL